ncbi:fatty acid desaturase, partial [bacterium AH-315-O15]|nr:fatty acid desaturase [bacterium AH-315-O15]
ALANVCIWPLFLMDVRTYRASHWVHHKRLGFPDDTEVSYHNPLSIKYMMELASWLHVVKTLTRGGGARASSSVQSSRLVPLIGIALHASIVGGTLYLGRLGPCVAWVIGLMTFAGLNGVRQLLEHRSLEADPRIDYRQVPHGPMNRMFSTGWMSRAIGAAGFNRHLLHHWDPGVSFTRFDEMEFFLMQTNLAADLDAARTTYLAVALRFLRREMDNASGTRSSSMPSE